MEEVNRYYNGPITLDEAESYIQSGLITAARVYVANGYYLRRIRDDRLFEERGYRNFEEYVRDVYNKDKGWASKCINVNQELSDGGDSPILSDRYHGYTTYQLVEIAYMTENQREEVVPDMTVKELREIRKPDPKPEIGKVVTSQLPSQSKEQQQCGNAPEEQKTEIPHFKAGDRTADGSYGAVLAAIVRKYIDNDYPASECEVSAMGLVCKVLRRPEVTVFYREDGCTFFDVENSRLEEEYRYWHGGEEEGQSDQLSEPEPEPVDEGYKPWEEQILPDENWNIGDLPQAKEKHVRSLARVFVEKMGSQLVLESFGSIPPDDVIKRKITELDREEGGSVEIEEGILASVGAELIEFFRGGEDLGVCSFARLGTQVRKALEEWQERESNASEPEERKVEEKPEEIIDGEYTEVSEPEKKVPYDLEDIHGEIAFIKQTLKTLSADKQVVDKPIYAKTCMRLDAMMMLEDWMKRGGK